jgi:hypothetical protein
MTSSLIHLLNRRRYADALDGHWSRPLAVAVSEVFMKIDPLDLAGYGRRV